MTVGDLGTRLVAGVIRYKYFFIKCFRTVSTTTEDKNIILKAYSTQKVGSGSNFESGNQGCAADGKYKLTI